jgi:hypothetical protein
MKNTTMNTTKVMFNVFAIISAMLTKTAVVASLVAVVVVFPTVASA